MEVFSCSTVPLLHCSVFASAKTERETPVELFVREVAEMSSRTGDQQTAVEAFELLRLFSFT